MISFKELRILDEKLIIDVSILGDRYFDNMYITEVRIDTQDTYIDNGSSSKPVYTKEFINASDELTKEELKLINKETLNLYNTRDVRLVLDKKDFIGSNIINLSDNIYYVYIQVGGTPAPDTPCGMDNLEHLGIAYNPYIVLQDSLKYLMEIDDVDNIPRHIIDSILRKEAFETTIAIGNYNKVNYYWSKFYKGVQETISKPCSCNG